MGEVSRIELDTTAMKEYARFLKQAPRIAHEELEAGLEESLALLERETKEATPTGAHGLLRGSVTHALMGEAIADGRGVAGKVYSPLNYALPVELGTKPHFPPIAPLRDWVEKKLGVPEHESASVAFLIARKIAAKGTKGAKMFTRTLSRQAGQINGILRKRVARIAARLQAGER